MMEKSMGLRSREDRNIDNKGTMERARIGQSAARIARLSTTFTRSIPARSGIA